MRQDQRKYHDKRRRRVQKTLKTIRDATGCVICQSRKSLHFHHRDTKKKHAAVSTMDLCSMDKILKEIKKCDVLCCSCHRLVHSALRTKSAPSAPMGFAEYMKRVYGLKIKWSEQKRCSKCKAVKPIVEFHKSKYSRSGLSSECKRCAKEYYEHNREAIRKQQKENPGPGRRASYRYWLKNRDRINRERREKAAAALQSEE